MSAPLQSPTDLVAVVVVGLGNIGSHLVPHLARMREVGRLVMVDPDVYGESNRWSQSIQSSDIGVAKVDVQADVAGRVNPGLAITRFAEAVEDVPLGFLRDGLIVTCLDSRAARQYVNGVARKLGVVWIDSGVEPTSWLARVNVYEPGRDAPCLECGWDQGDYDALPQRYPCESAEVSPATAAPSSLGALAAALQAVEVQKLLSGRKADAAVGAQVVVDVRTHKLYRTATRRNNTCRLTHADPLDIVPVHTMVAELTWPDAIALGGVHDGGPELASMEVPMHTWTGRQLCGRCGRETTGPRLRRALPRCAGCGGPVTVSGFDLFDELEASSLAPGGDATLEALGLRNRDVVGVGQPGHWRYVELGAAPAGEQGR